MLNLEGQVESGQWKENGDGVGRGSLLCSITRILSYLSAEHTG